MCVVWVRTGGLRRQQQLHSGLCPRGSQRAVLAYSRVWGKHILKAGTRFFLYCNARQGLKVSSLLLCQELSDLHFF